jgi:hypothetical protein
VDVNRPSYAGDPAIPPVPEQARPILTRQSLAAWTKAKGLSAAEGADRIKVQQIILASVEVNPRSGALTYLGNLALYGCFALTQLPEGLCVQGSLNLYDCAALTHLPEGFSVQGSLNLCDCFALTHLPEGLCVPGTLYLRGCAALTHLPEGLRLQGHLDINACFALTHLPAGLRVQGNLVMRTCPSLTHLPEGLYVQGYLVLSVCTALTALPEIILQWERIEESYPHMIFLENTGISLQTRRRLEQWAGQQDPQQCGIQLHFSEFQATGLTSCTNLQQAWSFWQEAAPDKAIAAGSQPPPAHPFMHLDAAGHNTLMRYLGGLRNTAEYRNLHTRTVLIDRVAALATSLRNLSEAEAALAVLEVAMSSCEDRLISGLDHIEQGLRVRAALRTGNLEALHALGLAELKLQVVRAHARTKVESLVAVDEVEVYLLYETRLAEALDLPVATRTMRYSAPVTEADLHQAALAARAAAADPQQRKQFLQAWPPWQQAQRAVEAKALRYDAMVFLAPSAAHAESPCMFTRETFATLTEPVTSVDMTWVAERCKLMTWWVEHGTDPSNRADLTLPSLRRLRQ